MRPYQSRLQKPHYKRLGMGVVVIGFLSLCFIGACQGESAAHDVTRDSPSVNTRVSEVGGEVEGEGTQFSDVLAKYQALNRRLESIAARLQVANAPLCSRTVQDLGLSVHTLSDYPEPLQDVAADLLPVSDRLSIRTIRPGSPAEAAGLRVGDEILSVQGSYLPSGDTAHLMYQALLRRAETAPNTDFQVLRGEDRLSASLGFETICGYPVVVFFSERVNGHTDGDEVWITSELIRQTPDDDNLALVVAHEMAHAIAGHVDYDLEADSDVKVLELEADWMALVLMERAGFDIHRAITFWQNMPHPHTDTVDRSDTHPSIKERLDNFRRAQAHIEAEKQQGNPLELYP